MAKRRRQKRRIRRSQVIPYRGQREIKKPIHKRDKTLKQRFYEISARPRAAHATRLPDLSEIQDFRRIRQTQEYRTVSSKRATSFRTAAGFQQFQQPRLAITCVRRRRRRRIVFATGKAGKGIKPNPRRKYTDESYMRC